jgi:hypothetical protein
MAQILCKHCGMPNAPERMVCSFCHQPLHVVDDDSDSILPGDVPTKKSTGELEPILPQWLRDARSNARRAEQEKTDEDAQNMGLAPSQKDEVPDLLAGLESVSRDDQDYAIPDWLSGTTPAASTPPTRSEQKEKSFPRRQELHWEEDAEDQLGGMATTPIPAAPESGDAMLPWMRDLEKEPAEGKDEVSSRLEDQPVAPQELLSVSPFASGTFKPPSTGELTDWLDKASSEIQSPSAPADSGSDDSLGEWLLTLPPVNAPSEPVVSSEIFHEDIDLPDWMKPLAEPGAPKQETAGEAPLPDWMVSFRETEGSAKSEPSLAQPVSELPSAPAFSEESLDSEQTKDLFSAEMPDWLSNIAPTEQKSKSAAAPGEAPQEPIAPADLPSWVQAMRPVETVLPDADAVLLSPEGPLEKEGPLAGLQGVLPLAGGLIQPGKSKAQAIRLQVSEAQQADASLLEKMLAAETQAKPLRGGGMLVSQRVLRWILSGILIALISFFLGTGLQTVPLPASLPAETNLILPVLDALPENAPVLMIFDYEPALAGELEAAAAPFVDHLLSLRHPRLTILSTSPTGSVLAERFLANTQAQHNYQLNQDYINLDYLPGGTIGILSFAENPRLAMPLTDWAYPPAQDVHKFSDYAAVVLLTDQAETARAWVEQTTTRRDGVPLLVVSSAQAAPMIQPYLLSGQVNGLVSGLAGGAAFEGSDRSGTSVRATWDAFNYATLLVAMLIVLGGLWNLIAGARARRRALDEV